MQLKAKGKTKEIYTSNVIIIKYTDTITAMNGLRKDEILGKGYITAFISAVLFEKLNVEGFNTHFESSRNSEHICKWADPLKVEVVVRNYTAGSICKRLDIPEGTKLRKPCVEFYLKDDSLNDPLLTESEIDVLDMLPNDITTDLIKHTALEINQILYDTFDIYGISMYDVKLEFGIDENGQLILIDELSPDNMRLRRINDDGTVSIYDKDLYRQGHSLEEVLNAYKTILDTLWH